MRRMGYGLALALAACSTGSTPGVDARPVVDAGPTAPNTATGPEGFVVQSAFLGHSDHRTTDFTELEVYLLDVPATCDDLVQKSVHPGRSLLLFVGDQTAPIQPGTFDILPTDPTAAPSAELQLELFANNVNTGELVGASGTLTLNSFTANEASGSYDSTLTADGRASSRLSGTFRASYCVGIGK